MEIITKDNVAAMFNASEFKKYIKKYKTSAARVDGPFKVETKEGTLSCPDGYVALDSSGWPYPVSKDDFEDMYVLAEN